MKAIILAAGKGTRLRPITNTVPKPLVKIYGKSIIEYNLESIYKHVTEIIIIVQYREEDIISHL
jgi:NDP-sugar pyrophosphorylase family protein